MLKTVLIIVVSVTLFGVIFFSVFCSRHPDTPIASIKIPKLKIDFSEDLIIGYLKFSFFSVMMNFVNRKRVSLSIL